MMLDVKFVPGNFQGRAARSKDWLAIRGHTPMMSSARLLGAVLFLVVFVVQPLSARDPIADVPFLQEYHDPFVRNEPCPEKDTQRKPQPTQRAQENDVRAVAVDKQGRVWA